jgi:hypothetical protein
MKNSLWWPFSGFLLIQLLIILYNQTFILTDDVYRLIVGTRMSDRQFADYLQFVQKWQWLSYLFIPLAILMRISFTWVCLKAGSFIAEQFEDTSFWSLSVRAEIVFTAGALASLLYTEFFLDLESVEQLSVNPFSMQAMLSSIAPTWSSYLLNTLNIFELCYILLLAYLIAEDSKKKFLPSLKFVASSYLPGLVLWILLVSYLSIIFQP